MRKTHDLSLMALWHWGSGIRVGMLISDDAKVERHGTDAGCMYLNQRLVHVSGTFAEADLSTGFDRP